jgi:hypothetical protein
VPNQRMHRNFGSRIVEIKINPRRSACSLFYSDVPMQISSLSVRA